MSARTITSATIDTYLKLLRRPADMMIARLPGQRTGVGPAARVILDRLDAAVRTGLAATLSDDALRAETGVQDSQAQSTRRRGRPSAKAGARRGQAGARRDQAGKRQRTRTRRAAQTEQRRTGASREPEVAAAERIEAQAAERIEAEAGEVLLPAVEEQVRALNRQEVAAEQRDEARRLGEAAARVKAEHDQENGSGSL